MENWQHNILIPLIVLLAINIPHADAQTNPQLSLTLVGPNMGHYLTPAGQTSTLKMEILNVARPDIYLLQGEAYLDPDLSGTWQLIHSEQLGGFHLAFLRSAFWTFDLTVPTKIQAANATDGTPQVNLLIKIVYLAVGGTQDVEQEMFALGVPGATIQQHNEAVWYGLAVVLILMCIGMAYVVTKRRRSR